MGLLGGIGLLLAITLFAGGIAYIGDRAPNQFRANVTHTDTYTIQAGSVYRTCVPNRADTEDYCVIVRTHMPLASSVTPDGHTPNSVFALGTN